jgi:RNA polymerase primary sigma factor
VKQLKFNKRLTDRSELPIELYLREIKRIPMVSTEEEVYLSARIKAGDQRAFDKLVCANLRFVVSVAKQYHSYNVSLLDLIGEGNLGLIHAAQKYDPTRGFKFISYAVWWIRQSIMRYIKEKKRIIRLPVNVSVLQSKINKCKSTLEQGLGREPNAMETANALGIEEALVLDMSSFYSHFISLDEKKEGNEHGLLELLPSESFFDEEKICHKDFISFEINRILAKLPPRDVFVLIHLFGLNGTKTHTLVELGETLGLTAEAVRQIKIRGLMRLQKLHKETPLLMATFRY